MVFNAHQSEFKNSVCVLTKYTTTMDGRVKMYYLELEACQAE